MFDLIMDWIVGPLLDMLSSKHFSGEWRLSYLFPVATALGVGLWWVGNRFDLILVLILGVLLTVVAGLASILTWFPREKTYWQDMESYRAKRKRETETAEKEPEKKDETPREE